MSSGSPSALQAAIWMSISSVRASAGISLPSPLGHASSAKACALRMMLSSAPILACSSIPAL
jgi:hypothetical protein